MSAINNPRQFVLPFSARNHQVPTRQRSTSEVVLQRKLNLARVVWIILSRCNLREVRKAGEVELARRSEVGRVGHVENLATELEVALMDKRELAEDGGIQAPPGWVCDLSARAAKVRDGTRCARSHRRRIGERTGVQKLVHIVWPGI